MSLIVTFSYIYMNIPFFFWDSRLLLLLLLIGILNTQYHHVENNLSDTRVDIKAIKGW